MPVSRMHDEEVEITDDVVRRLLADELPESTNLALTRIDTWGTDHVIYRLGDELSVRLPKIGCAAAQGEKEACWLPVLAPHLPAQVPTPVHVGNPGHGYPYRWYVAPWLPGRNPNLQDHLHQLAEDLAAFVLALENIDAEGAPAPTGTQRGGPLPPADERIRFRGEQLRDETDVDTLLSVWVAGRDAPPWDGPPRWVHADLMDGNLLVRDGRLTGVIDWGGLKAGDPAVELMVAWSLFDADSRETYRAALGFVDDTMWLRGRAWAVEAAINALPYYRDTNPDIVARSWRAVDAVLEDAARTR